MSVLKTCPCCEGRGYITKAETEGQTWVENCFVCDGTGSILTQRTNADRIRDMSDEELANEMRKRSISTICDIVCQGECKAIATLNKTSNEVCKEIIMKWLQQPAEEDT